jgi:putative transcriptional regulator
VLKSQVSLGDCRIKKLLKRADLTQVELAEATGLPHKYINDKANNRGPRGMTIVNAKKIATVLGCSIDDLYEWKIRE